MRDGSDERFLSLTDVSGYDFDFFQGGHVNRPGTRQDFEVAHQYIIDIQVNANKALQITNAPLTVTGADNPIKEPYLPFNTYLEAASEVCAQITLEKWRPRLRAADLYTKGHCWTTILDLIID